MTLFGNAGGDAKRSGAQEEGSALFKVTAANFRCAPSPCSPIGKRNAFLGYRADFQVQHAGCGHG